MTRPAELAGRWLEPCSNVRPRGMAVHDRTRLNGQLHLSLAIYGVVGARRRPIPANCLIFKHYYLMRYFQYAQYPFVFIGLFLHEKTLRTGLNKCA